MIDATPAVKATAKIKTATTTKDTKVKDTKVERLSISVQEKEKIKVCISATVQAAQYEPLTASIEMSVDYENEEATQELMANIPKRALELREKLMIEMGRAKPFETREKAMKIVNALLQALRASEKANDMVPEDTEKMIAELFKKCE